MRKRLTRHLANAALDRAFENIPRKKLILYAAGAGVGLLTFFVIFGTPEVGAVPVPFPPGFVPVTIFVKSIGNDQYLRTDAARAFLAMQAAAAKSGIKLSPNSGFRSVPKQALLYAEALAAGVAALRPGETIPPTAAPGRSNHNQGLSVDIETGLTLSSFAAGSRTATFNWLAANSGAFGFKRDVPVEPWHYTFQA